MKKIPTLFEREFKDHNVIKILPKVHPGMEWVLKGEGVATVKYDGSCCAIIDGEYYKRYDCKKGKIPPEGFIPCCEPDTITGHWPGWVKVDEKNPADKWFVTAYEMTVMLENYGMKLSDGTYEAVGRCFQNNPYNFTSNKLIKHGKEIVEVERTFYGIKKYLSEHEIEGLVFWKDGIPQCKIKRSDFGFEWPVRMGGCTE
jgi:hypothetical protein